MHRHSSSGSTVLAMTQVACPGEAAQGVPWRPGWPGQRQHVTWHVRIAKFATTLPLDRPMACLSAPVVLGLRSAALPARSSRRAAAKPVAARAQQQRVSVQATTAAAVAGASAALGWSTLEGSWCWKATHAMLLPACPGAGRVLM